MIQEIIPSQEKLPFFLPITKTFSAHLKLEFLPDHLLKYAQENFESMFGLHPQSRGKVIMQKEEVESKRWHKSYLQTPKYNGSIHNLSYMYSGFECDSPELPREFSCFLNFLNLKSGEKNFNQVIVNWYENGSDFTPYHSDCTKNLLPNSEIVILTLNDTQQDPERLFTLKAKRTEKDTIYQKINILTENGLILSMCGDTQAKYRHSLPKMITQMRRISITFRKVIET